MNFLSGGMKALEQLERSKSASRVGLFLTSPAFSALRSHANQWETPAERAILVLGSARSGTTWLAKIFDSHPDSLYRHEPDELSAADAGLAPRAQLVTWIAENRLRVAAKRPFFHKSWRPAGTDAIWRGCAAALAVASRTVPTAPLAKRIGLPDLIGPGRRNTVRPVVKLVSWDGTPLVRTMPDARAAFIIRHPCGQIASILAGLAGKRIGGESEGADVAVHGRAWAARHGIDSARFDALRQAERFAWAWRAFNEPAVQGMAALPNAKIVVYEDLCSDPVSVARALFAFAGLDWHQQTDAFVQHSTQGKRSAGYFDVFRKTAVVADSWKQRLLPADRDAVLAVVKDSPLAAYWGQQARAGAA